MLKEPWQRTLAAVWVSQLLTMVAWSFFFPFIPLFVQSLGVQGHEAAAQWAGAVSAAGAISMATLQPYWGARADRVGRKPMVVRAMAGGGLITLIMGLSSSPLMLVVLRFIQGGISGTVPASNALVASCTPRRRLGFALGLTQVAMFLGFSVGPLGGGLIADSFGYGASFFAAGVLQLLGGAIVAVFACEEFKPPEPGAANQGVWAQSRALMATAVVPMAVVVVFLIQFGGTIVGPVLSLFIVDLAGGANAATTAGIVLAAGGAASAVSALALGRMGDRVGHSRVLSICLLGAAITYFPQAFVQDVGQLLLLRVLLGLFLGGLMPSANALLANAVAASQRGAAFGLTSTANGLANAVGPLSGAAITTFAGMRPVFIATAFLYAFACGWVTLGLRRLAGPAVVPDSHRDRS